MQLFASTKIKQRQGLAITVQLQQAIKLLHYNNIELANYLEEQAQENPFIELAPAKDEKPTIDSYLPSRADKRDEKVTIDNQFETGDLFHLAIQKRARILMMISALVIRSKAQGHLYTNMLVNLLIVISQMISSFEWR